MYVPTFVQLLRMLDRAQGSRVPIAWLMTQLGRRSFGLTFFLMGTIALVPGASTLSGVLLAWPAIQMFLGHEVTALPGVISRRTVSVDRLARVIRILVPRLTWLERLIRPRWPELFQITRWMTGLTMLLLGLTMISPVPFGHVLPALLVMLLAVAYMEEDGLVLLVALIGALGSLAITVAMIWGTVATVDWLDPAASASAKPYGFASFRDSRSESASIVRIRLLTRTSPDVASSSRAGNMPCPPLPATIAPARSEVSPGITATTAHRLRGERRRRRRRKICRHPYNQALAGQYLKERRTPDDAPASASCRSARCAVDGEAAAGAADTSSSRLVVYVSFDARLKP
jgi:hypothetical protein